MKKQVLSRQRQMRWRRRKRIHSFDDSSLVRRTLLLNAESGEHGSSGDRPLEFSCDQSRR